MSSPSAPIVYEFDDIRVEPHAFRVLKRSRPLALEPKGFEVLLVLLERPGELVDRDTLLDRVWRGTFVTPNTLTRIIAQLRRALGDDREKPKYIETVHTRGYRFATRVTTSSAQTRVESSASSLPVFKLPARLSLLIGRESDVQSVEACCQTSRLVTLVGPGGVGKTQLGLEIGRRLDAEYPDGVCHIDLAACSDPSDVPRAVAAVLDVREASDVELTEHLARVLTSRKLLLFLDNCEHVAEPCGHLALSLLRGCPDLHVLASSQHPFNVASEVVYRVPSLTQPPPDVTVRIHDTVAGLERYAAIALFVARAQGIRPSFALSKATAPAIVEICRRLDGIPLALELAAARTKVLSVQQIADRLDDRFNLLSTTETTLGRHQTLQAAVEWSYGLLSGRERLLLERLTVFVGGWSLEAAEAVCSDEDIPGDAVLDVLSRLVDRSLVVADPEDTAFRYRMLDTIRVYLAARLEASGQRAKVCERHLEYFVQTVTKGDQNRAGPWDAAWLGGLEPEHGNLRAAFEWALSQSQCGASALTLASGLRWYWWRRSQFVEGCDWLERALTAARQGPNAARARALIALGHMEYHLFRWRDARHHLNRGLALCRKKEDAGLTAFALCVLACMEPARDQANAQARKGLALARASGDAWLVGYAFVTSGLLASLRHQSSRAVRLYEQGKQHLDQCGDSWLFTFAEINQALQCHLLGEQARAAQLAANGIRLAVDRQDRRAIAAAFETLAHIAVAVDAVELGARLLGAAEALREVTAVPLVPHWLEVHQRTVQIVRRQLGPAATDARLKGRIVPISTLLEEALTRLEAS